MLICKEVAAVVVDVVVVAVKAIVGVDGAHFEDFDILRRRYKNTESR